MSPLPRRMLSTARIFASPLAKKTAREAGQPLDAVANALGRAGSGPNNRILQADVAQALAALANAVPAATSASVVASAPSSVAVISSLQTETIFSDSFVQAKRSVPHYYLNVELNLKNLLALRQKLNLTLSKTAVQVSVNDFIVKAAAISMRHVPDVNASWMDTFVRRYEQVNINVFMHSGDSMAAPVLHNVGVRGLSELAQETSKFALPESGSFVPVVGTFSVHNLGMFGVKSAAPIVLSPQSCALGLGTIVDTVVPSTGESQTWTVAPMMMATLSCDHRVVDGAVAAEWLAVFKRLVENPEEMLL